MSIRMRRWRKVQIARTCPAIEPIYPLYVRNLVRSAGKEGWNELPANARRSFAMCKCLGVAPQPALIRPEPEEEGDEEIPFEDAPTDREEPLVAAVVKLEQQPGEHPESVAAAIDRPLASLRRELGFSRLDQRILRLLVCARLKPFLARLLWSFPTERMEQVAEIVASAIDADPRAVRGRIGPEAPLLASGLVAFASPEFPHHEVGLAVDSRVVSLALAGRVPREKLLARFLTVERPPTLTLADFEHMRPDVDAALRILRQAIARRAVGVNLLFHGSTGVGKSELARLLSRELGVVLYLAGAADDAGESPSGQERLASLSLAQRLLAKAPALVLFDEAEDVSSGGWSPFAGLDDEARATRGPSKLWFTRRLELNPVPSVFITNDVTTLDPALVRRFTLAVGFEPLGAAQRKTVWARHAGDGLPAPEQEERAHAYDVSPAEIANAVGAARLAGDGTIDRQVLDRVLEGAVQAIPGRKRSPVRRAGAEYRPDAVNASTDLVRLADRLVAWKPGRGVGMSLVLYGPPGTGKTEFVHHVAKRMGREVVVRHVSEIESMWVGGTEKNIARAFAEAEARDAVLLFDEVDTFLRDRRLAKQGYEHGFVNEFLQRLEACKGFVACTTNLFRDLDQAALRRFAFKVEFRPLRPGQAVAIFDAHLAKFLAAPLDAEGRAALEGALRRLGPLTPGDFAAVARRVAALSGEWSVEALVAELSDEVRCKGPEAVAIGF